jgi:cystathionine beta-lyase
MVNNLELFGIGASWGGYESLLIPVYPEKHRSAVPWNPSGQLLRIHAGLESLDDLIVDLEAGLDRLST